MIKAIIFDMDGVLVNSTKYIWKSFNTLLSKYNIHISDEKIKKYLGRSLRDQIKMWKEDFNIKENIDIEEFSKKAFEMELKLMEKELIKNKDPLNLVNSIKEMNIKVAVATSSHRFRAEKILEIIGIKDKLDALVTAQDVENHKPHPEIFLKAAEELKVKPEQCVVIEDAVDGIEAAKAGKMKAIGFLTPYNSRQELIKADLIVSDFRELKDKLKELK